MQASHHHIEIINYYSNKWLLFFLIESFNGSVYNDATKGLYFVPMVLDKTAIAYGTFDDSIESNGWGQLTIKAGYGSIQSNNLIMKAAGFLEGYLTAK